MAKSAESTAKHIWLHRTENALREQLDHSNIPFLGLYLDVFRAKGREYFRDKVVSQLNPVGSYIIGLSRWPATFAAYLTIHVVEGYGRSGTAEVYPFVRLALGMKHQDLTQSERGRLWRAYRTACVTLGLSVLPSDFTYRPMALEYLSQAGVPIRYLPKLFKRFSRLANLFGLPDAEDPEEIREWQQHLNTDHLQKPVIRAIENDQDAYYGTLYVHVSALKSRSEAKSKVERIAYDSLDRSGEPIFSRPKSLIPKLEWRDGELGISLPPNEPHQWSIEIEQGNSDIAETQTVPGESDHRFVPLSADLPTIVTVASQGVTFRLPAWESPQNNRAILFDRRGRLVASGSLGNDPLLVRPGQYTLLTRWEPSELTDVAFRIPGERLIFASEFQLQAAKQLTLTRGHAKLEIKARDVAALEWMGTRLVGMLGRELYSSNGLAVNMSIPNEIRQAAIHGLELVVKERGGSAIAIPVESKWIDRGNIELSSIFNQCSLGVRRISVRLRRPDIPNRSLAAISSYVWNGLVTAVPGRFICVSERALNIDRSMSDNVRLDGASVTYADSEQRFFRTVFNATDSENATFNWPVPGVFVYLEERRSSQVLERPLKYSELVQVHPGSRQKLKIYSTEPGTLMLGEYSRELRNALLGGTQFYLSSLADYISASHQVLQLKLENSGVERDLVKLVTPHEIISYATKRTADSHEVIFQVVGVLEEFQLITVDVISGNSQEFVVTPDDFQVVGRRRAPLLLTTSRTGTRTNARLECFLNEWNEGEWINKFRVKINGRWGNLVNARGDVFASSTRIGGELDRKWYELCRAPVQHRIEVFERLTILCQECYSQDAWHDLKWIGDLWQALARTFATDGRSQAHRLLGLAMREVPDTTSESWVPIKSVATSCHWLFSLPWTKYEYFSHGSSANRLLFAAGSSLSKEGPRLLEEAFLDPLLALAFHNGALFLKDPNQELGTFQLTRYFQIAILTGEYERRRVLSSIEWRPAPGDYLGARHYWWAVRKMSNRLRTTAVGNEYRRGQSLRLAQRVRQLGSGAVDTILAHSHLTEQLSLGVLDPWTPSDYETDQANENLCGFIDLLSLLAYVARLNQWKQDDPVAVFVELGKLIHMDHEKTNDILAFVLYIGMELFVFYLALWEFVLGVDKPETY